MISVLSRSSNLSLVSLTLADVNCVTFFLAGVTPLKSMLSGLSLLSGATVSLNNAPLSISLCPLFSTIDDSFFMEIDAFSTVAVSNIVITLLSKL